MSKTEDNKECKSQVWAQHFAGINPCPSIESENLSLPSRYL